MDAWLQVQDDTLRLYENLGKESENHETYEVCKNVRKLYIL
jgi:hypothetical protein